MMHFRTTARFALVALATLATLALGISSAQAQSSSFTYQGRILVNGNAPVEKQDIDFSLWNAETGGMQIGSTISRTSVQPSPEGLIDVELDFGTFPFYGEDRWLQLDIKPTPSSSGFTTLSPRIKLTAAPAALSLVPGASVDDPLGGRVEFSKGSAAMEISGGQLQLDAFSRRPGR